MQTFAERGQASYANDNTSDGFGSFGESSSFGRVGKPFRDSSEHERSGSHGHALDDEGTEEYGDVIGGWSRWLSMLPKLGRRRVPSSQMFWVCKQMSLLLETGVDLTEALELVAAQTKHNTMRICLEEMHEAIGTGASLSQTVREQSEVIGPETAATLQAGEASGRLTDSFRQLAERMDDEIRMKNTMRSALAYPLTLFFVSQIVAVVLIWFVLPQFAETFTSMAIEPPLLTRWLIQSAAFVRGHVLMLGLTGALAIVAAIVLLQSSEAQRRINKLCFSSPILGSAVRNIATGQVFVTCGNLLSSGIPLLEAIRLVRDSTRFPEIHALMDRWESEVLDGRALHSCMHEFAFLPEGCAAMLQTAEKTGRLAAVLVQAGEHYRSDGTNRLRDLLKLAEPAIILVLGVVVGGVVASVLLPMLDIQTAKI